MEIKSLAGISIENIHSSFKNAFEDYVEPFDLSISELKYMIERRGYDERISFGAFVGKELVGFTLNGKGIWDNVLTAYDTGTGVIKEYRKQGLATRIFIESLHILRENGIRRYLLEVIRTNTKAFDLYKKAGFSISREFDYYTKKISELKEYNDELDSKYNFENEIELDWVHLKSFWDFNPSWQNSIDAIYRKESTFKIIGISFNKKIIGYGVIHPETGDIPQFCIDKEHRGNKLATALFFELIKYSKSKKIQIINTEKTYIPLKQFLKSINITPGLGQYEMIMKL